MLEHGKKRHTEISEQIVLIGPVENRLDVLRYAKEKGYIYKPDSIPWNEAFPNYDEQKESGVCLAGARYKEGLTQKQLAEITGIPQRHISEMENGKRPIGKKNAKKFSKALNIGYQVFL
ncbi:HTH domain-containing protein, Cro/C1-type [Desulfonema limicola]|uniref:HTH domain-containing protein, Cro/C1-type n=1 Tax=Desulfonema limicola TaxID=45656 RepID=A0A975BEH7_9BACT|nr:helix-turn-helix transcriptional regulator [Desulfonema limicola]QTA83886.1 HTH domain-containing protein, Cro/C1-type [Desulfonema limicola]